MVSVITALDLAVDAEKTFERGLHSCLTALVFKVSQIKCAWVVQKS